MSYHRKAFELVSHQPEPIHHDFIGEFATKRGLEMPSAVKEFYGVRDAVDLLRNYSNCDDALEPLKFEVTSIGDKPAVEFLVENQGCCRWAFQLEGNEDPPVWVDESAWGESPQWNKTGVTFSTFVYLRFFDFQYFVRTLESAEEYFFDTKPVTMEVLSKLREQLSEEASTYDWPKATKYRFWRNDQRIILFVLPDYTQWHCFASTTASQEALFTEVKHLCEEFELLLPPT